VPTIASASCWEMPEIPSVGRLFVTTQQPQNHDGGDVESPEPAVAKSTNANIQRSAQYVRDLIIGILWCSSEYI
jgi:hypothetical protein